ncbi:MAG: CDP-diacylglycerol--serine O-phosphatidyltransferase [Holosporaceae bacterium]|jgi:CDP-diacylglycerol--serine O-phosphatidyltransferase|nr:CDP-diacylglycerol--serine O-phosphatidyltransferase [Holosporaceae bacterium]
MSKNVKEKEANGKIVPPEDDDSVKKGASLVKFLPSIITISAFCVGLTSIRFALDLKWELAALCIFVSALLDSLDGRVARLIGQSSQFGAQLDSLSDLVCFGVAPAIILFLRSTYLMGGLGWGVGMFFTVCCALRLARFNADMLQNENQSKQEKKFFKGVPAPAGAILSLFPMILFFQTDNYSFLNPVFISICLLVSGSLMISRIRTFSSKMIEISNGSTPIALLVISSLVICLITEIWMTLSVLVTAYLLSIPYGIYEYSQTKNEKIGSGKVTKAS